MALPDSMFLFEIFVEDLKSYNNCREFCIKSQFADVFSIKLRDPNEQKSYLPKRPRNLKPKRKTKVRNSTAFSERPSVLSKVQTGQSILFESNIDTLISNMKQYPMELSLWSKLIPDYKIGSTHIPWSASYIDYLNKFHRKLKPPPVCVKGDYNIFDECTSKRMAVITLHIKLSYMQYKITTQLRSLSEENPQTLMYTGSNPEPTRVLSTIKNRPINLDEETSVLKTIYNSEQREIKKFRYDKNKNITKYEDIENPGEDELITKLEFAEVGNITDNIRLNTGIVSLVKSETKIYMPQQIAIVKSKSCSSIGQDHFNILNYIFGGTIGPFGNQVYYVGYFTVVNDLVGSPKSAGGSVNAEASEKSDKSDELKLKERYKFRICDSECLSKKADTSCTQSVCSLDLPQEASHLITINKCDSVNCDNKIMRKVPTPPDDRIMLDMRNRKRDTTEKVEEIIGGVSAKMKIGNDPCFCECECRFGFTKRTTYCGICGGYEIVGEEHLRKPAVEMPFPCPIFHKLLEKGKMKPLSLSGSDYKRKDGSRQKSTADKSPESEKETTKKGKKKKKDDRFKFNYGYTAPQIGHSHCAMPCTGTLGAVPKNMGWLWTADDVPGIKFRPLWKPGAVNKHVLRLLKIAKNPGEIFTKKRKREIGKPKRALKRPLLIVQKKDGEYTVTMETMRTFSRPRTFNQYPYEDKPLVTYTIGRTAEENHERKKKKERARRQLEKLQREFIQSAFSDMCQEICLKTYQQALGILPDTEQPNCSCYPAEPDPLKADLDGTCSCSEDTELTDSDTDCDEWIVEFTPPNATFDPTVKSKKIMYADNSTQYSFMDYRVKLLDRYGNPVPRFFKGPDGKQQCSDLGGFWGPNNKWLEINTDGYIGPDEKWAPNVFIGPNEEQVDGEAGKFQAMNGKWLVVGVDGYVDSQGKWKFYAQSKVMPESKKRHRGGTKKKVIGVKKQEENAGLKPSETTWSCFGSVSPKDLSRMGIIGHGQDKKLLLTKLQDMLAHGEDIKIPKPSTVPRISKDKVKGKRRTFGPHAYDSQAHNYADRKKCKHATPPDKGIVAVDEYGNKTYFRLKNHDNKRPKKRITTLTDQGISLSSFHVPCFHSFISSEMMKKQLYERRVALSKGAGNNHKCTTVSTQAG